MPVPHRARRSISCALALFALVRLAHAQQSPTSSPAPLENFTVTYRTQEFGVGMGPALELVIQSDGTAHLNDAPDGRTPVRSIDVHLPPSELAVLARLLADPAFVHATPVQAESEGRVTTIDVRSPRENVHHRFEMGVPPGAAAVVSELARLRDLVARRVLSAQSVSTTCANDADCRLAACNCRCVAVFRGDTSFHCSPGHCVAQPCRSGETATCDPSSHRCMIRPHHAP